MRVRPIVPTWWSDRRRRPLAPIWRSTGTGFGATEGVDVFFDLADLRLRITDPRGGFTASIVVPSDAVPGVHWISALGRRSGALARAEIEVLGTASWPQEALDAGRTSWTHDETALTSDTVAGLRPAWTTALGSFGYVQNAVASADTAYVVGATMPNEEGWDQQVSFLAAIDLESGRVRWQHGFPGLSVSHVALAGDVLVVGATRAWQEDVRYYPARLLGLDAGTGGALWSRELSASRETSIRGLAVDGDTAYVSTSHYRSSASSYALRAVRVSDGAVRWDVAGSRFLGPLAVSEGTIVVGSDGLVAFDAATGAQRWRSSAAWAWSPIAASEGRVFAQLSGEEGSSVAAFDLVDGSILWTLPVEYWWLTGIASSPGRLLMTLTYGESPTGEMWSVDPATGAMEWKVPGEFSNGIAAAGDVVYTVGGLSMIARSVRTGERLAMVDGVSSVFGIVNGRVLSSTADIPAVVAYATPAPPAPRARALVADPALQPDRGIEPHEALTDGWTPVAMDALAGDLAVTGSAIFEGATYLGTLGSESGGLFRLTDDGTMRRIGEPGFGDPANAALQPVVAGGRLFVVTTNDTAGLEVWSSSDGEAFDLVADRGFGDVSNRTATPLVIDGRLVLGVVNDRTGAQLWAAETANDPAFTKVLGVPASPLDGLTTTPVVFDGSTYVGTLGLGVTTLLRSDGGRWEEVAVSGVTPATTALSPQVVFQGAMYVVAASPDGLHLLRTTDGVRFDPVGDGFSGSRQDADVDGRMVVFGDDLYLIGSSLDPRVAVGASAIEVAPEHGFELWRSTDGLTWQLVDEPGLGDPHDIGAVPLVVDETMYLAAANHEEGDTLYRSTDGTSWEATFREASTSHASVGLTPVLNHGYLVLFHGDLAEGLTAWRSTEPVTTQPASNAWVWTLALVVLALALGVVAIVSRRRRGPKPSTPPTLGPTVEHEEVPRHSVGSGLH